MLATEIITSEDGIFKIDASANEVLIKRASIIALKKLGIEKDWESVHVESIYNLASNTNGKSVNLPKDIVATREYDFIVLYKNKPKSKLALPFKTGEFKFLGKSYSINAVSTNNINLKDGLYIDADKIPEDAVIRTILEGDKFTKFGGGTKPLAEFFTDKKIPLRNRQEIPLLCKGETVLAVFGIAISELVRVDENTKNIININ